MTPEQIKQFDQNVAKFIARVSNRFMMRLFMLRKLPMAWMAGIQVRTINEEECVVTVPYRWLNQNPFKSTYFAVLSMAAEMSTGLPALMYTTAVHPPLSMLVYHMEGSFNKKAVGLTRFVCQDIDLIREAVLKAIETKEPQTVTCRTEGWSSSGIKESDFHFTWTFKAR